MSSVSGDRDTGMRIRVASLQLFAERGYANTSLRELAERLGLTKAALYYHFRSKEDILRSLIEPVLDQIDTLLDRHAPLEPNASLSTFLSEYIDILVANRPLITVLASDPSTWVRAGIGDRVRIQEQRQHAVLAGAMPNRRRELRAWSALGALRLGALQLESDDPAQERHDIIEATMAALGDPPSA